MYVLCWYVCVQVLKLEGTFSFAAPEYISIWDSFTKPQLVAATTLKVCRRWAPPE